uniref:Type II secretion pathway protein C n=1 Tax=Hydrogenovibrio crunogenus (strain DSM 25203 / XCL-2) TaxID=317025 RepID=Q31J28_HYDCU
MLLIGITLCAWILGGLVAFNFNVITTPTIPSLTVQKPVKSVVGAPSYLMGREVSDSALSTSPSTENMPLTRLNLKLIGLVDLGTKGVALIQSSQTTYVVSRGEEFLNDLILQDIGDRYVILNNRGQLEKLLLVDNTKDMVSTSIQKLNSGTVSTTQKKQLKKIGAQLKQSPLILSQLLSFKIIERNGQWEGVKVWPKADKALFKTLGFREGDVVTHINGKSIKEIAQNQTIWKNLMTLSQFELIVKRNNDTKTLQVNLD